MQYFTIKGLEVPFHTRKNEKNSINREDLFCSKSFEKFNVTPMGIEDIFLCDYIEDIEIGGAIILSQKFKDILTKFNCDNLIFHDVEVFTGEKNQNWESYKLSKSKFYYLKFKEQNDILSKINFSNSRFRLGNYGGLGDKKNIIFNDIEMFLDTYNKQKDKIIIAEYLELNNTINGDFIYFNNFFSMRNWTNPYLISEGLKEEIISANISGVESIASVASVWVWS